MRGIKNIHSDIDLHMIVMCAALDLSLALIIRQMCSVLRHKDKIHIHTVTMGVPIFISTLHVN